MPAATRFENAHGHARNYFGTREQQDARNRPSVLACFGCGGMRSAVFDDFNAPEKAHQGSSTGGGRHGSSSSSTAGPTAPRVEPPKPPKPPKRPAPLTVKEHSESASASPAVGKKDAKESSHEDRAAEASASPGGAAICDAQSGPSYSSAYTEVFHPWRHPRKPKGKVSPAGASAPGAAAADPAAPEGPAAAVGSGVSPVTPPLRRESWPESPAPGAVGTESPRALHPTTGSSGSPKHAASSPHAPAPESSGTATHTEALPLSSSEPVHAADAHEAAVAVDDAPAPADSEPPTPVFIRRGASCSGADNSNTQALAAAAGAQWMRNSMARRASYAADGSAPPPVEPVQSLRQEEPFLMGQPPQQRPSGSLRPTPPSHQPHLAPSNSLIRHQQAAAAAAAGLAAAPDSAPSPPLLLRHSLNRGTVPGCEEPPQRSRLDDQPPLMSRPSLMRNGCSFGRNVTTKTAVAALTAPPMVRGPSMPRNGSMARGNALPPMPTPPTAEEAAAALARLASLQKLHQQRQPQRQQSQQQPQQAQVQVLAEEAAPAPAPAPAPPMLEEVAFIRSPRAVPAAREAGDEGEADSESVVGDLPHPAAAASSASSAADTQPSGVRRAVSYEPAKAPPAASPRVAAISDTGEGAAAPFLAQRWLESLAAAAPMGPEPLEALPEPQLSAGSLQSAFDVAPPPRPAPVASAPMPGAIESYKCLEGLLNEIEPCGSVH